MTQTVYSNSERPEQLMEQNIFITFSQTFLRSYTSQQFKFKLEKNIGTQKSTRKVFCIPELKKPESTQQQKCAWIQVIPIYLCTYVLYTTDRQEIRLLKMISNYVFFLLLTYFVESCNLQKKNNILFSVCIYVCYFLHVSLQ